MAATTRCGMTAAGGNRSIMSLLRLLGLPPRGYSQLQGSIGDPELESCLLQIAIGGSDGKSDGRFLDIVPDGLECDP
jgi:hypothetical protein